MKTTGVRDLARKYWDQGLSDLKNAKNHLAKNKLELSCLLTQQAALNCMNGVCHSGGFFRNHTYNLSELIKGCTRVHSDFHSLTDLCSEIDELSSYRLFKNHHRGGQKIVEDDLIEYINKAENLISQTKTIIKKNDLFKI